MPRSYISNTFIIASNAQDSSYNRRIHILPFREGARGILPLESPSSIADENARATTRRYRVDN